MQLDSTHKVFEDEGLEAQVGGIDGCLATQ